MSVAVEFVADDRKRDVYVSSASSEDVAKFLQTSRGKDERRLPKSLHGRSRDRVSTGGGMHARITDIEDRIVVPEC